MDNETTSENTVGADVVAKFLGLTPETVLLKARRREIPSFKRGKKRRFLMSQIRAWFDGGHKPTLDETCPSPARPVVGGIRGESE
jgi:hypothetical protein